LADWPVYREELVDESLEERFGNLEEIRDEVLKSLEMAREKKIIGNSLEAFVSIKAGGKTKEVLSKDKSLLPEIFIVSEVSLDGKIEESSIVYQSERFKELVVGVSKTKAAKCERCWRYLPEVGTVKELPNVCLRCADVVKQASGSRM